MSDLKGVLESFCKLEGVRGAMVVGNDGAVSESHVGTDIDAAQLAQVVAACANLGEKTAHDLGLESLNQTYLQFGDFNVTSEMLASRACLVILADSGANLGRIRLEIRKNRKIIEGSRE